MKNTTFYNINQIIQRDSKTSTYKFALLRGTIDIIQENSPYITFSDNKVHFPIGLLIEKWLCYYYPILESAITIPQINGETNLAFQNQFNQIILAYKNIGGFSAFYNDLKNKGIPPNIQPHFLELAKKLQETITKMPMKYIGRSITNNYYSIFNYTPTKNKTTSNTSDIDIQYLINSYGQFSIPVDYFETFDILGSFISGQDSILFKWAEFSVNASGKKLSIDKVINEILKNPTTERDIQESKKTYKNLLQKQGKIFCVWTGKAITNYDIDHMIPFSIFKNNDLWNLLPAQPTTNNNKRNKIPSPNLLEKRKDLILHYWELLNKNQTSRFQKEIQVALIGNHPHTNWQNTAITQLQNTCQYLITNRGFEQWEI